MMQAPEPQLDDLYRELIMDHYRSPRNRGRLDAADVRSEGYNPLCGDEIALDLSFENGTIAEVAFDGRGCSISQASASMMTDAVQGLDLEQARHLSDEFRKMMTDADSQPPEELGDLEAFHGVAKFPVRVKCATLAWRVLEDGLEQRENES
jgi:nitrogen fixation protein NifU and related proteins